MDKDDRVRFYLRELAKIRPLTSEEEADLLQRARTRDYPQREVALKRLIEAYLSLVVAIAEWHSSQGIHLLDLIEMGNQALMVALDTFSGDSYVGFADHARTYVEKAIAKAIASSQSATS